MQHQGNPLTVLSGTKFAYWLFIKGSVPSKSAGQNQCLYAVLVPEAIIFHINRFLIS